MDEKGIRWNAPEFVARAKTNGWYWLSIFIAVGLLALAVWQRNFLFGFFILVAEVLVLVWGNEEPRQVQFEISSKGIRVDEKKFYAWSELQNFSVDEGEKLSAIFMDFRHRFRPSMRIYSPTERLAEIKSALQEKIKETEYEPNLIDALENLFRF